jgi:hypothetical protein
MKSLPLCLFLLSSCAFAQLPEAPQPQHVWARTWENVHGKPASFVTFRGKWKDPALRSNRQTFKSPIFVLGQSAMFASMIVACRNPRSGEAWHSEAPAVGALFGLNYLSERFFSGPHALGPAVYAVVHYSRSAAK